MARLFKAREPISAYKDRHFHGDQAAFEAALRTSTTVYVGNLSFYTTEEQVYEVFSRTGEIRRIIMGLDKNSMTPCGFCFVQYYSREDTEDAVKYISGTILDDRPIRVDFDWGFEDGRQWGRGRHGGQVRDEYRTDYDPDILSTVLLFILSEVGGYGKLVQKELAVQPLYPFDPLQNAMMAPYASFPQQIPYSRRQGTGGYSGHPGQRGSKRQRRHREDDVQQEVALQKPVDTGAAPEKNPRFRERDNESDDEAGGNS
eukprot:SM000314S12191  [mRNA]  locus=s314:4197:6143:- [translate_table: standard]